MLNLVRRRDAGMVYLISYDLAPPAPHEQELIATLEALGATRILESVWVLTSRARPADIRDRILREAELDRDTRILVCRLTGDNAWRNLLVDDATVVQIAR